MSWIYFAITSALCWGLHYAVADRLLQKYSVFSLFIVAVLPVLCIIPFIWKQVSTDLTMLASASWQEWLMLLVIPTTFAVAAFSIMFAIQDKNAVHASLIEITYPLFTAIFAAILFQYRDLDARTIIGGIFILVGTMLIVYERAPVAEAVS